MLEKIKHRIEDISKEVEELHPLLQELFQKHPRISHVEYTHGTNEMGADFVLTCTHEVLGTTEHIGIIAKRGKIQQKRDKGNQSIDDVERQIKECVKVPRRTDNGKREVRLSQVWVICTGAISNGAKARIHSDHPGTNVHFIDVHQLSGMVDKYVPHYWSSVALPVSTYLSDTKARSGEMDKSFDLLQLEGEPIYIEQDVVRVETDPYRSGGNKKGNKTKRVNVLEELDNRRLLLIEADMGGGKSKLLRRLTQHYADALQHHLAHRWATLPMERGRERHGRASRDRRVVRRRPKAGGVGRTAPENRPPLRTFGG